MTHQLEPAKSIIDLVGGPETVMEVTGASPTRVYRWTQPKERGGTGGSIPLEPAKKLLRYAQEHCLPLTADRFFEELTQ